MKILVVMGTRPEAIKLAPVVAALRRRKAMATFVCATGQHRELLDQVLDLFSIVPDFDLKLMRAGQTPDEVAKRIQKPLSRLLARLKPDLVIVHGDTTSAAAAAVCAFERGIPVAHVEAGLRSFDMNDPYPEERNRVLIDSLASLLFPPTPAARRNLSRENMRGRFMLTTGNSVVDALRWARRRIKRDHTARRSTNKEVLVTLHRRELHGAPLKRIYAALLGLVRKHQDLLLIYPVHPNPKIQAAARTILRHPRIRLLDAQPYLRFLKLLDRSRFLITDSGGLQEEAVCLGKPVLVVRRKTERPEVISSGAGRLLGLDAKNLARWTTRLLNDPRLVGRMRRSRDLYGDGRASERIAAGVAHWFGLARKPKDWNP